ncbi:MAG: GNAT family N-acetyltransferase [Sinomonas sp.]|nr:GNAT family N-acetyltransferase [Sinomonas sp.]
MCRRARVRQRPTVGWCAVEPRTAYPRLGAARIPWAGRDEDPADDGVWSVTCFVVRGGYRKQGIARALARATVDFARGRGARAIEAYPVLTSLRPRPGGPRSHEATRSRAE